MKSGDYSISVKKYKQENKNNKEELERGEDVIHFCEEAIGYSLPEDIKQKIRDNTTEVEQKLIEKMQEHIFNDIKNKMFQPVYPHSSLEFRYSIDADTKTSNNYENHIWQNMNPTYRPPIKITSEQGQQ